MPGAVKFSGYAALVCWSVLFLLFGINLLPGFPAGGASPDPQLDRIALPVCLTLSLGGIVMSLGMIRAKRWAYRAFVAVLAVVAPLIGLTALLGMELTRNTAAVALFCACGMFLLRSLLRDSVREFFGLPPAGIHLLRAPGWWSLGMGAICLPFLFWPIPTPLFGVWLGRWPELILNLAFTAGSLALGVGLLARRTWVWPAAIVLALAGVLYTAGTAWDPNPQGKLSSREAPSRQSTLKAGGFGLALSSWTLRRIWLHRRAASVEAPTAQ